MGKFIKKILFLVSYITFATFLFTLFNNIELYNVNIYLKYLMLVGVFFTIIDYLRYSGIMVGKILGIFIYDAWELRTKAEHNRFMKLKEEHITEKTKLNLSYFANILPGFITYFNSFLFTYILISFAIENPFSLFNLGLIIAFYTVYKIIKAFYFMVLFPNKGL